MGRQDLLTTPHAAEGGDRKHRGHDAYRSRAPRRQVRVPSSRIPEQRHRDGVHGGARVRIVNDDTAREQLNVSSGILKRSKQERHRGVEAARR